MRGNIFYGVDQFRSSCSGNCLRAGRKMTFGSHAQSTHGGKKSAIARRVVKAIIISRMTKTKSEKSPLQWHLASSSFSFYTKCVHDNKRKIRITCLDFKRILRANIISTSSLHDENDMGRKKNESFCALWCVFFIVNNCCTITMYDSPVNGKNISSINLDAVNDDHGRHRKQYKWCMYPCAVIEK